MTTPGWIITGLVCFAALVLWLLNRREKQEMAAWDDSDVAWPDEETRGMD